MSDYLMTYEITLETLAPLFIGSGMEIGKKEYIYYKPKTMVMIPKLSRMYQELAKLKLDKKYEDYLLNDNRDLATWFRNQKIEYKQYLPWMDYELNGRDAEFEGDSSRNRVKGIQLFIKDAYGCPYVPGSSLKGALRTVFIGGRLIHKGNSAARDRVKNFREAIRNNLLKNEAAELEGDILRTMNREGTRRNDAVNDVLSGLIVSDSRPLRTEDLTLCRKIDVSVKGDENKLNILRECIKPNTKIRFTITIDSKIFPYRIEDILDAMNAFYRQYEKVYKKKFLPDCDYLEDVLYLGGGSGYATKTVTYPLLGEAEGVKTVNKIIDQTLSPKIKNQHKHSQDMCMGVSPHMLKCTKYQGRLYEFGLCRFGVNLTP